MLLLTRHLFTQTGFFRTGDQGKPDKEEYLTLTERIQELINKGGENVFSVELDNTISQHQTVASMLCFAIHDYVRLRCWLRRQAQRRESGQSAGSEKMGRRICCGAQRTLKGSFCWQTSMARPRNSSWVVDLVAE